ncbi:MAG: amidohydrolase family protein, partial [Bacilli bacterium]
MQMWANAHIAGQAGEWDILVEKGLIARVAPAGTLPQTGIEVIDLGGNLVCPPFVEPHVHLDTTLTAGEPRWNVSGTLFEGIERWAERKSMLTHEDVKRRAKRALQWQIANGIQHVRTHVDTTDPSLTALRAMLQVKEEMAPWVDIQIVAFPQEGIMSYPDGLELLDQAMELGADVVGGIPHYEFTREDGVESIRQLFSIAEKYNKLIDIH